MDVVVLGLSLSSSWGNGHATTWRSLLRAVAARGHRVVFLERERPWYADNRDLDQPGWCALDFYASVGDLKRRFTRTVREADLVLVGSYVPDGIEVGDWVLETGTGLHAFYDIDTPVTLAALERGDCAYLSAAQIAGYDLYLSFTGGPVLGELESRWGSPCARALYCSVDPAEYLPRTQRRRFDLGYLGTWSEDRQPALEKLLIEPARRWPRGRFVVAGPQYPDSIDWPANVHRIEHLAPPGHAAFYGSLRFALNLTRADMVERGWSPSVRLFEAAACATPVISDVWDGLSHLFEPHREILLVENTSQMLAALHHFNDEERDAMGAAARRRVLAAHTSMHRAIELEDAVQAAAAAPVLRRMQA